MAYGERRQRRQDELGIPNEDALVTEAIDTGLAGDPRSQIAGAYTKHLGREGSPEEIASHMGRGYNLSQSLSNISGSQEAQNYAKNRPATTRTSTGGTSSGGIPPPVNHTQPVDDPNAPAGGGASGGGARSYDYIPGAEEQTWGDTSRLSGFNTNEWGPGGTEGYDEYSYKNTFGKLASKLPPTPESVRQLVNDPEFKARFPNAILVDHPNDPKIQFEPNDPPVDVLIASGAGGWGWQPGGPGGGVEGGGGGLVPGDDVDSSDPTGTGGDAVDDLGAGDTYQKILDAIAAAGRGETPMLDERLKRRI